MPLWLAENDSLGKFDALARELDPAERSTRESAGTVDTLLDTVLSIARSLLCGVRRIT